MAIVANMCFFCFFYLFFFFFYFRFEIHSDSWSTTSSSRCLVKEIIWSIFRLCSQEPILLIRYAYKVELLLWQFKGIGYTFKGGNSVKIVFFLLCSQNGSTLKGKNLLPTGSKFFPFKVDPFWNRLLCRKYAGSHKSCLPWKKKQKKKTTKYIRFP